MKPKNKLNAIQIIIIAFLLFVGICCVCNKKPYVADLKGNELEHLELGYLHEGDYSLVVTYQNAPNATLLVKGMDLTSAENARGVLLFSGALDALEPAQCIGTVTIPEGGLRNMQIEIQAMGDEAEAEETKLLSPSDYIVNLHLQSLNLENRDGYYLGMLLFICAALVAVCGLYFREEQYLLPFGLGLLGLIASYPLMDDYILYNTDIPIHMARIEGIYRGLKAGEFPVYINTFQNYGYGTLSATMYPSLFLYPFALLRFLGVSLFDATKSLLIAGNIATAAIAYISFKEVTKSKAVGLVSSILYVFSLYRINDMYYRGAVGEGLAMIFMPLLIWGLYEILWGDAKKWYVLMLGVSGVMQSHVLSATMGVVFLAAEVMAWLVLRLTARDNEKWKYVTKRVGVGLLTALGTICLNASFLVPFLKYSGEDLQAFHWGADASAQVVYLSQMFAVFPKVAGLSLARGTTQGEMPLTVGGFLLLGVAAFGYMAWQAAKNREQMSQQEQKWVRMGLHFLVYAVVALLFASWFMPWNVIQRHALLDRVTASLQYIWRLFAPASVLLCLVAGIGLVYVARKLEAGKTLVCIVVALNLCSAFYFMDSLVQDNVQISAKTAYEGIAATDSLYYYYDGNSYRNPWFDPDLAQLRTAMGTALTVQNYEKKATTITAEVTLSQEDNLVFPLVYYTGYKAYVDGKEVPVESIIEQAAIRMPAGTHAVRMTFDGGVLFHIANWVSGITVVGIIFVLIRRKK